MRINTIGLFPEMFTSLNSSIIGIAQKKHIAELHHYYLRDFAYNKYGSVDDAPYGGEGGMVLSPEPLAQAIKAINPTNKRKIHTVFLTPQGKKWTQKKAKSFSQLSEITLICGHYKGIDQRIRDKYVNEEISIGDFVLTGGELPAMIIMDSIIRLLPKVVGNTNSITSDSFYNNQTLGFPVYTRPETFEDMPVPSILLSGNHQKIKEWRKQKSQQLTQKNRPDLI